MKRTAQVDVPPEESLRRHVIAPVATAECILDREYEEVDAERRAFEQFNELDGTRVPAGSGTNFTDALDEIAHHRQETVANRTASSRTDGHELRIYLYSDCDWTYPVLTAVTRLRGAVDGVA